MKEQLVYLERIKKAAESYDKISAFLLSVFGIILLAASIIIMNSFLTLILYLSLSTFLCFIGFLLRRIGSAKIWSMYVDLNLKYQIASQGSKPILKDSVEL